MNALIIARRDLASYLQGYSAYIIIAGLLFVHGLFFVAWGMQEDYSNDILGRFFYLCWGFAVATAVLLTMRSLAEEHARGTEVLLRTSVISDGEVVVGKWLAAMGMVVAYVALTLHMPLLVAFAGKVSAAHLAVGYFGVLLGGAVASALGILSSAVFRNQLAAGIIAGLVAIYMAIIAWMLAEVADPPFADVLSYTALFNKHFVPFMEGRFSLSSVVYQGSLTALLLYLATQILNHRRWE